MKNKEFWKTVIHIVVSGGVVSSLLHAVSTMAPQMRLAAIIHCFMGFCIVVNLMMLLIIPCRSPALAGFLCARAGRQ